MAERCMSCHNRTVLLEEATKDALTWKRLAIEYATDFSELSEKETLKQIKEHFTRERKKTKLSKRRKNNGKR